MAGHDDEISRYLPENNKEAEPHSKVPESDENKEEENNRTLNPHQIEEGGSVAGQPPAEGDPSYDPANTKDGQEDGQEDGPDAAPGGERHGEHREREPAEQASRIAKCSGDSKDTVRHPDSTEGPKSAVMDRKPDLKKDTEQSQGDNRAAIPEEHPKGGSIAEKPPAEGDLSHGPANTKDEQADGPKAALEKEQEVEEQNKGEPVAENVTDTSDEEEGTKDDLDSGPYNEDPTTCRQRPSAQKLKLKSRLVAEDIGPVAGEIETEPAGTATYWILLAAVVVGLLAMLGSVLQLHPSPELKALRQVDIFHKEMTILKTQFHGQRPELWNRSRIHLERHLQTARPTEPVSLILTAGRGAERTLYCLAQGLASAFSAAHNASVLRIDGAATAGQDSDRVKMDIDRKLQGAFGGGDRPAAVIHRFEELPPSATLIFYRYCDHENAAFKKTFLLFTVLLEEPELAAEMRLSAVEELVDDRLQRKFLSPGGSVAFDRMDRDKYSGLWSRISHLILPVARQPLVEQDGC